MWNSQTHFFRIYYEMFVSLLIQVGLKVKNTLRQLREETIKSASNYPEIIYCIIQKQLYSKVLVNGRDSHLFNMLSIST